MLVFNDLLGFKGFLLSFVCHHCASVQDEQRNTDVMLHVALFKGSDCIVADALMTFLSSSTHSCVMMITSRI